MLDQVDKTRKDISPSLNKKKQSELGQYFTPKTIANFMASLFNLRGKKSLKILDAGAGIGMLSAAVLEKITKSKVNEVELIAYEIDEGLIGTLIDNLNLFQQIYSDGGKELNVIIRDKDFIEHAVIDICLSQNDTFDLAILNPPYLKINLKSEHRRLLQKVKIETVNLYTGFVAVAIKQLKNEGQLVVIIPRSFCNGPYYKSFREFLLESCSIKQIHLFESRNKAFKDDGVLQENIILSIEKGGRQEDVLVSTSSDGTFKELKERQIPFNEIIKANDDEFFIHIPTSDEEVLLNLSENTNNSLKDLKLNVSTGPVVDFRVKDFLLKEIKKGASRLIYPAHFDDWGIKSPIGDFKKFNAIVVNEKTSKQLYPTGYYTIVKRFSSKEEKRRIIARVITPDDAFNLPIGFENHLNVFHWEKKGLTEILAYGICVYLNSTAVDEYFRIFSGHTQVNVTDLKSLKYPSIKSLEILGRWGKKQKKFEQIKIDNQVARIL